MICKVLGRGSKINHQDMDRRFESFPFTRVRFWGSPMFDQQGTPKPKSLVDTNPHAKRSPIEPPSGGLVSPRIAPWVDSLSTLFSHRSFIKNRSPFPTRVFGGFLERSGSLERMGKLPLEFEPWWRDFEVTKPSKRLSRWFLVALAKKRVSTCTIFQRPVPQGAIQVHQQEVLCRSRKLAADSQHLPFALHPLLGLSRSAETHFLEALARVFLRLLQAERGAKAQPLQGQVGLGSDHPAAASKLDDCWATDQTRPNSFLVDIFWGVLRYYPPQKVENVLQRGSLQQPRRQHRRESHLFVMGCLQLGGS